MICTHIVHMGSPEREEAVPFGPSRYVLYLESTIAFFNIDYSSEYAVLIYGYVRPSQIDAALPHANRSIN